MPPTIRQSRTVRLGLLAVLGCLALLGVWFVRTHRPGEFPFYPPCMLHVTTGLHCPGCGATRCVSAVLDGEFEQAVAYNPLALLLLPAAGLTLAITLWHWAWGTRPRNLGPSKWWYIGSVVVLVTFGILRNIPAYPFTLLAPHKL